MQGDVYLVEDVNTNQEYIMKIAKELENLNEK